FGYRVHTRGDAVPAAVGGSFLVWKLRIVGANRRGVRDGDASGPLFSCCRRGSELHQGGGTLQRVAAGVVRGNPGTRTGAWRPAFSPRAQPHPSERTGTHGAAASRRSLRQHSVGEAGGARV